MTFNPQLFDPMQHQIKPDEAAQFYNKRATYNLSKHKPQPRWNKEHQLKFFTGVEVENTPAKGLQTLFVIGAQDPQEILLQYAQHKCKHIFFGADHSFTHKCNAVKWMLMIAHCLNNKILCSLDIPPAQINSVSDILKHNNYPNFIAQIRLELNAFNSAKTYIKLDDKLGADSGGIWTHTVDSLKTADAHTPWSAYELDQTV